MNKIELKFSALIENEPFVRTALAAFILPLNPSISELEDIKTAVNEAVTNVIVHAYPDKTGYVEMKIETTNNKIEISISDNGVGITDIERALTPFYTSKPDEERSGMGFTVMESFMDKLEVKPKKCGLTVYMNKVLEEDVAVGM